MLNPDFLHFDNNGTTPLDPRALAVMKKFASCSNPSRQGKDAAKERAIIQSAEKTIMQYCGANLDDYTLLFTSGASESNNFILQSCCYSFHERAKKINKVVIPHIIISATEHASLMGCAKMLQDRGHAEITYVQPDLTGRITLEDVKKLAKKNTCLISIMYANNELPVINDIRNIASWALIRGIPLHSDAVQIFGKFRINIGKIPGLSALSFSAHKFYGPKGCGGIVLAKKLVSGYGLKPLIAGKQQHGLRGGTENVCAIASMAEALKSTIKDRDKKNRKLLDMKNFLLKKLDEIYNFYDYSEVLNKKGEEEKLAPIFLVTLGPTDEKNTMPNTILLAICKTQGEPFCNVRLSKWMEKKKITIGIGSTCNSVSSKASHVLDAIQAPPLVKRGVIRISFGDKNKKKEVGILADTLIDGIEEQCGDLD
jgi:cysteine desulfurase